MQVGEEDQALAEAMELFGDRLLDLQDHVGFGEHGVGVGNDRGAGLLELSFGMLEPDAGIVLDDHLVTVDDELADAGRRDRDAVLVVLQLRGTPTFMGGP